jgi:hypothetical protein
MSAETRTTSSSGGQKGVKLERFDLIPVGPLTSLATHFGRGARKYDDNQWRKGYEWSKSYAAKQRHDNLFWAGFDYDVCENDPEGCAFVDQHGEPFPAFESEHGHGCYNHTTSHHLDASNWHGFVLREFTMTHPEHDDRYRAPEPEPELSAEERWRDWFKPSPSTIVISNAETSIETLRLAAGLPLLDWDEEPVEVGGHEFDPHVRFVVGSFETTDLQPYLEIIDEHIREMAKHLHPSASAAVNESLNRRD